MGGSQMLKNPMKKKILYNISKDQNSKSGQYKKMKGLKNLVYYIMWKP